MDDALDDASSGKSDYQKGIQINQEKLGQDLFPCQIQKERLENMDLTEERLRLQKIMKR